MVITVSHLPPSKTWTDGAATVQDITGPHGRGKGCWRLSPQQWTALTQVIPVTSIHDSLARVYCTAQHNHTVSQEMPSYCEPWRQRAETVCEQHWWLPNCPHVEALSEVQAHSLHLRSIHSYWRAGYITATSGTFHEISGKGCTGAYMRGSVFNYSQRVIRGLLEGRLCLWCNLNDN